MLFPSIFRENLVDDFKLVVVVGLIVRVRSVTDIREENILVDIVPDKVVHGKTLNGHVSGAVNRRNIHHITTGNVDGYRYRVIPVRQGGTLTDIRLNTYSNSFKEERGLPEELSNAR